MSADAEGTISARKAHVIGRSQISILVALLVFTLTTVGTAPEASASGGPGDRIVKVRQPDGSRRWQSEFASLSFRLRGRSAADAGPVSVDVEFVEFVIPNDPRFVDQWNFNQVRIPTAWDSATGVGVTVAVLDTGVSPGPDLACRAFVAPFDTFTGFAGMDAVRDLRGHGTHVTGTIAQCTDNAQGFAGTARDATIMPVRVLDDTGTGTSQRVANGILHAVENGADVINLSLGFDCFGESWPTCGDYAVDMEIEAAVAAGVVIVAAAGNDGFDHLSYPANHPLVIAVGASDATGTNTDYSSGGTGLDLLAPGGQTLRGELIYQETVPDDGTLNHGYFGKIGTSMAAPHVSGIVAMMLEHNPSLSPLKVRCTLIDTVEDVGAPGWDPYSGWGEVRADTAVTHRGEFFTDVTTEWFEPDLSVVVNDGIVDGFKDCTFRPESDVTRAQSVKLLVVALDEAGIEAPQQIFTDVPGTAWSAGFIQRGYEAGWVTGYEDGTFRPGVPITRIDLAVFATKAMGYEPIDADVPPFPDVSTDDWFHAWLTSAKVNGVIHGHGDGTFRPSVPVTRAQAVTILYNMLYPEQ